MATVAGGGPALAVDRLNGAEAGRVGTISPIAWNPSEDMDVVGWLRMGRRLSAMTRRSQWWLGDWIRYGTARWGEKYKEAARITGYDVHTLRNIAYVAGRIDVSRRRDNLTWSHHAEVCALASEEQEMWLDLAAAQRMSVADLRVELRARRRGEKCADGPAEPAKAGAKTVTCPACEHLFEIPAFIESGASTDSQNQT